MKLKRYKKDLDYSYSYGVFPTLELLQSRTEDVSEVHIHPNANENEGVQKIKKLCSEKDVKIFESESVFRKLLKKENIYAIGVFRKFESSVVREKNHLVLVNPSSFGNLGTIIRTSLGFGVENLSLIKPSADIFNPEVIRASMGSVFKINFEFFNSLESYIGKYQEQNVYLFYSDSNKNVRDSSFIEPFSLIFGNESSGLAGKYKEVGQTVQIPQSKEIDSLNLAVSVGIGLYEATK